MSLKVAAVVAPPLSVPVNILSECCNKMVNNLKGNRSGGNPSRVCMRAAIEKRIERGRGWIGKLNESTRFKSEANAIGHTMYLCVTLFVLGL